ncbi:hypothetical protein BY458DRAFT_501091 [Sporodiniella umbellata]|nr:hypothetical protein BY458DRAFT_501091 [Sporodiniella umbellata]
MIQRRLFHCSRALSQKRSAPLTPLTSKTYPMLKRNPKFSEVTEKDVDYFRSILTPNHIVYADPKGPELEERNTDWYKVHRGVSNLCLFPTSTEQVSKILSYCHERTLAVVPQGGKTGLSGGPVPVFDEVIINSSKMNRIRQFDEISGVAVIDAGVVLENLASFLESKGHTVPLDLGAKGTCQIGGNVSTNAGGLRVIKFGNLHGNVVGLEVVLPDGTILDSLTTHRKDNTGYDLKQLFIGSEGTLGFVTGVSLSTPKLAKSTNVAMLALDSFETVQKAFVMAKEDLSEILSAFEFWDHKSVEVVKPHMPSGSRFPIEGDYPFYALLETQGSSEAHDQEKIDAYIERLFHNSIAKDGSLAHGSKQVKSFFTWREYIPEAIKKDGPIAIYDLTMDIPLLYKLVEDLKDYLNQKNLLGPDKLYNNVIGFGHLGDGNLHLMSNVDSKAQNGESVMDEFVYDWTVKHNGSISSEHGIGISKLKYLNKAKSKAQLDLMRVIKNAIDPKGIMNPYKVIPDKE